MNKLTCIVAAITMVAFAGCASGPPPTTEFPAGARAPTAAEVTTLLQGKSYTFLTRTGVNVRVDYAPAGSNTFTAYYQGKSHTGTWNAEDGQVCSQPRAMPASCNPLRLVGKELYLKRDNGDVVKLDSR